jgi:hypothetical protein
MVVMVEVMGGASLKSGRNEVEEESQSHRPTVDLEMHMLPSSLHRNGHIPDLDFFGTFPHYLI